MLPWRHCRRDHFSLQKNDEKYAILTLIFEKIFWGHSPQTPYWGGATAPLPRPNPPRRSGASRLRASLGTFGPSIDDPACPPNEKIVPAPLL